VRFAALLIVVATTGTALAHPPPEPEEEREQRPAVEYSTWFRLAMGMRPHEIEAAARATTPPPTRRGQDTAYEVALGGDVTIGAALHENLRVGPWFEIRGLRTAFAGGEVVLQRVPKKLDMFLYDGEGVLALRAGANAEHVTAQIAYGYLAPWNLFRRHTGDTRYMIGVRFVASYTRGISDPGDWIATIGLETEPVGAIRYLLGIRSWY